MWLLLLPYWLLVVLYLVVVRVHDDRGQEVSVRSAILKCLPILYLIVITFKTPAAHDDHAHLKFYLCLGLICSMCGDCCLNWFKQLFVPGALCFAVAHILYIIAFGFTPLSLGVAIPFGVFAALTTAGIYATADLRKGTASRNVSMVYVWIICTMGWRAAAYHVTGQMDALASLMGLAGALVFMLSDSTIAVHHGPYRLTYGSFIIMTTYYIGQFLLAVSVVLPGQGLYAPSMKLAGI